MPFLSRSRNFCPLHFQIPQVFKAAACAAIVLTIPPSALHTQTISGTVSGTVRDSSGAVVPHATVTITNTDQNSNVFTGKSNSAGQYTAPFLPVGNYAVTAVAPGFQKAQHNGIKLNVNENITIDMALEPGSTQQTVTVTTSPLQVDLQSAQAQTVITGTQVRELSLNTRNYEQLVSLMPGVSTGVSDQLYVGVSNPLGTSNQINFSINGSRPTQNTWNIDGADNVDRGANLTLLAYPSVDSIAEFSVQRSSYNAEFGRSSSGQVNVITSAGTNQFHGDVYEFFRNDALDANTYLNNRNNIPIPALRYNDFGGTVGGPIWRDHTFFFFSEEVRRIITYSNFLASVPSTAELHGDLSASQTPVCVLWSAPGPNQQCLQQGTTVTQINPAAQAYLTDIFNKLPPPDPNCTGGCTLTSIGRNIFNLHQEIVRVDHVFIPRFRVFGRFENDAIPTTEPGGLFIGSALPGVSTSSTNSPGRIVSIHATYAISPTLINDAGYNYSHGGVLSTPIGLSQAKNSPDVLSAIKLPYTPTLNVVPTLSFSYFDNVADRGQYRDFNDDNNAFDHLSKIVGRHAMKFGVSYHWYQKDENSASGNQGTFGFPTTAPDGTDSEYQEWANFLTGNTSSFGQASADFRAVIRQQQWEMYAQDSFQMRPNLTLTYGLRYSLFGQPTDAKGHLTNFDTQTFNATAASAIDPYTGKLAGATNPFNGVIIGGKNSPYGDSVNSQNNLSFAPRVGFAYDPTGSGKMSIRGGYGIFFDSSAVSRYEINVFTNPPFVNSLSLGPTPLDNPSGTAIVSAFPAPLAAVGTRWHTPYSQEFSLDVQRQFPGQWLFDIGYYGATGTHLLGEVDLNQPLPGAYVNALAPYGLTGPPRRGSTTNQLNFIRPYPGFDSINDQITQYGSNYNGLQVALQKRIGTNSLLNLNYTWSKAMTNAFNDTSPAQNTYDLAAEYGPARYDRTHIFNANFVYDLPFYRSQTGFVRHTLGGWELSGIVSTYTGLPYTVTGVLNDPAGQGVLDGNSAASGRPDLVGNPNEASTASGSIHNNNGIQPWFNTSAYAQVCPTVNGVTTCPTGARPGDSHPGSVRGPGLWRADLSGFKNIKFNDRMHLQFRAEAFNVFNHTNPDTISTSFTSSLFGKVTGYRDPRILQLALKLYF